MGRKIPGRKHRGVKDPEKQQAERFAKIKDKINAPPSHPEDQQIPGSLSRIIDLKNKVKQGLFNKKKKQNKDKTRKISKNPTPKFEQYPGETDRDFKHRMNRICSEVIKEAAFENKYQVDIKRNQDGEVEKVVKRPKDELEQLVKKLKKEQKSKKNYKGKKINQADSEQPKLTKSQKWALKKTAKKNKKQNNKDIDFGFVPQKESFQFGDIVHAPPTLVAPKKVQKIQGAARPGQKELLLKSMLTNDKKIENIENNNTKKTSLTKVAKSLDKKGKRKDMPHALRRQLDKQQKEVIEAYKKLKSKKHTGLSEV